MNLYSLNSQISAESLSQVFIKSDQQDTIKSHRFNKSKSFSMSFFILIEVLTQSLALLLNIRLKVFTTDFSVDFIFVFYSSSQSFRFSLTANSAFDSLSQFFEFLLSFLHSSFIFHSFLIKNFNHVQ